MYSVTQFIKHIDQPKNGYVPLSLIETIPLNDKLSLSKEENLKSTTMGVIIDYLTRFMLGMPDAFVFPFEGAKICHQEKEFQHILNQIVGLDSNSIIAACQLIKYDSFRRCLDPKYLTYPAEIPNAKTINNIIIMVNRSVLLFSKYNSLLLTGFTFKGAYNHIISSGDGDYLTNDTLWDLKVSKYNPTTKHTLQLLVYYLLGISSVHNEFGTTENIAIFNPRLNTIFKIKLKDINPDYISFLYSKEMDMDVSQEYATNYLLDLKKEKRRKFSAKLVRHAKQELDYDTYLYAVWYDGNLISKVPEKYRDSSMCLYAFCRGHYESNFYGFVSNLENYLHYVPQSAQNQNFYDELIKEYFDSYSGAELLTFVPIRFRSPDLLVELCQKLKLSELDDRYKTPEFFSKYALTYPTHLDEVPSQYHTRDVFIQLASCGCSKRNISKIPEQFLNEKFFIEAIYYNSDIIKVIPPIYLTEKVYMAALNENPSLLKYVPTDIKCYEKLCFYAVSANWRTIKYVPEIYRTEKLFAIATQQSKNAKKYFNF